LKIKKGLYWKSLCLEVFDTSRDLSHYSRSSSRQASPKPSIV
jgi:hypothetical protein